MKAKIVFASFFGLLILFIMLAIHIFFVTPAGYDPNQPSDVGLPVTSHGVPNTPSDKWIDRLLGSSKKKSQK